MGDIKLEIFGIIKDAFHVPKHCIILGLIQKLAEIPKIYVYFHDNYSFLINKVSKQRIGLARIKKGLYIMNNQHQIAAMSSIQVHGEDKVKLLQWQLGHPSLHIMNKMFPTHIRMDSNSLTYEICEFEKHKRTTYPPSSSRSIAPFSIIHWNIWGPSTCSSINGQRWLLYFVDDCTPFTWTYLMSHKLEAKNLIQEFYKMI